MGSMGKRRGRRTRSTDGGSRAGRLSGFEPHRYSAFTPAGAYERLARLTRMGNQAKHDERRRAAIARTFGAKFARAVYFTVLSFAALAVLAYLVDALLG